MSADGQPNELGDTSTLADPGVVHEIISKKGALDEERLNVVVCCSCNCSLLFAFSKQHASLLRRRVRVRGVCA